MKHIYLKNKVTLQQKDLNDSMRMMHLTAVIYQLTAVIYQLVKIRHQAACADPQY